MRIIKIYIQNWQVRGMILTPTLFGQNKIGIVFICYYRQKYSSGINNNNMIIDNKLIVSLF